MPKTPPLSAHPQKGKPRFRFSLFTAAIALAAALAFCSATLPAAHAQSPAAKASVDDTNVEAGQSVEYHIQVTGGQPSRPPPAPQVDGLTITYSGESRSVQLSNMGNGYNLNQTTTYTYNIDADRAGRYVIPGQEISVNSTPVRVSSVALNVTGPGGGSGAAAGRNSDQTMFIELSVGKKTAYVGESIPVEVKAYFGVRLRYQLDPNPVLSGDGFSTQKFTQPQGETQEVEGVTFNVVRYKTSVTAVKTGEISIGPVDLQPVVQMPRPPQRNQRGFGGSPFNDPMFADPFGMLGGGMVTKQVRMHSDPVRIEVKPLPPGAPEDFSGAIGQFKLEAEAQGRPNKAQAGDPLTLHAVLRGQGNFDRIQAPVLIDENGLQTYSASAKFKADDDTNFRGVKTFEQVVIARNARNTLPGYRFVYLDPSTGKYATLETPPIPVKVQGSAATPTPTSAPDQNASAAPATGSPAAKPTPTPKAEDILYIRTEPGQVSGGEAFLPLYLRREFWLAQLAPLALLLAFAGIAWNNARTRNEARRRAADLHRQQSELVRTLQGEKTDRREFYSAATRLAQLKASAAVGRASSSMETLTADDVCRVQGLDPATAASVEEIFHRHDELSYSGGRAARETVPQHERRDVLATLETVGKL